MRILELTLAGLDLDMLRRFYVGILGFRELEPGDTGRLAEQIGGTGWLAVQIGHTCLAFVPGPLGAAPQPEILPRYHFALDVPPGRFVSSVDWLLARTDPIASPTGETLFHSDNWNADNLYFSDPQGNILELIARHGQPEPAAAVQIGLPFNPAEVIGITEIGLPADNVVNTVDALIAHMPGLKIYSGEGSDSFTAVGSQEGLFIVVRRGRIWFPETGVPAEFLPLTVIVAIENGRRCQVTVPPYPFSAIPESG